MHRKKSIAKLKSVNLAHERENGIFAQGSAHDCRGPSSFLGTEEAAISAGKASLIKNNR